MIQKHGFLKFGFVLITLFCLYGMANAGLVFDYLIPPKTITVDGDPSDWSGIEPIITDSQGDGLGGPGTDIKAVYLAKDDDFLYWRIDTQNGTFSFNPDTFIGPGIVFYDLHKLLQNGRIPTGGVEAFINTKHLNGPNNPPELAPGIAVWYAEDDYWKYKEGGPGFGAVGTVAEGKIPLSYLNHLDVNSLLVWYHGPNENELYDDAFRNFSSYYDTFDGITIDQTKWNTMFFDTNGSPFPNDVLSQNNTLQVNKNQNNSIPYGHYGLLHSKMTFSGDFDFRVSFSNWEYEPSSFQGCSPNPIDGNSCGGPLLGLQINYLNNDSNNNPITWVEITRRGYVSNNIFKDSYFTNGAINGIFIEGSGVEKTDTIGKLRLSREGTTVNAYYFNNATNEWILLKSYNDFPTDDVTIQLKGYTGYNTTLFRGEFDDVEIVRGTPTQGIVTGKVVDGSDNPVANVDVGLVNSNGQWLYGARTDSNGNFIILAPAGSYKVQFNPSQAGQYYLQGWYNNGGLIGVTTGQTTTISQIKLQSGGAISGRVTRLINGSYVGVANVDVGVTDANGQWITGKTTDSQGYYFFATEQGAYKVTFAPWKVSPYLLPEYYNNRSNNPSNADWVNVEYNKTTPNINAVLEAGGIISGKVTDSNGNGLSNVNINVNSLSNVWINGGRSNSDGSYSILVLPGDYMVNFFPNNPDYVMEWFSHKPDFNSAGKVTANLEQTTPDINAQLATYNKITISGRVVDSNGVGIANVVLNGIPGYPKTNANGYFNKEIAYAWSPTWSGMVLPVKSGYIFTPSYGSYTNINTNQVNQDFTGSIDNTPPPVYYDDFSGPDIDPTKWSTWDFVREIRSLNGERKLFSKTAAYGLTVANRLELKNVIPIGKDASGNAVVFNHLEADVTVLETGGNYGPNAGDRIAQPEAGLAGLFYNDGSGSPGSYVGEVMAKVYLQQDQGQVSSRWAVIKFLNPNGSQWELLGYGTINSALPSGQTSRLSLNWDPVSRTFTFGDGVSPAQTFAPPHFPIPAKIGWKALRTQVNIMNPNQGNVTDPTLWGKVSATFDNVTALGKDASGNAVVVTDDFSSEKLDANKWATYEKVLEIQNGQLVSKVRGVNINDLSTNSRLAFINPDQVNEIKANVALTAYSNPAGGSPAARLGGFFYNDTGNPNSGSQGDVWAQVALQVSGPGQSPSATWTVVRFNNSQTFSPIATGSFPIPVNLNQPYNLSIKWDGTKFSFRCDDYWAVYTPQTQKYAPNTKTKGMETRIGPPGPDAFVSAIFDVDTIPPSITNCSALNRELTADSNGKAAIPDLTKEVIATDNIKIAYITQSPAAGTLVGIGTTPVTIIVADAAGNKTTCTAYVKVVDITPPVIINPSANPGSLWPPNHKMVDVAVNYTATDNSGTAICSLAVSSNEPINGKGDGNTSSDWAVIDAHKVKLRSERSGNLTGRIYTINITCTDLSGNSATKPVFVTVPHDLGKKKIGTI